MPMEDKVYIKMILDTKVSFSSSSKQSDVTLVKLLCKCLALRQHMYVYTQTL